MHKHAPSPCTHSFLLAFFSLRHFPGELEKVLAWFRDYKIPDGKPANKFGYDNKCMDRAFANKVCNLISEYGF